MSTFQTDGYRDALAGYVIAPRTPWNICDAEYLDGYYRFRCAFLAGYRYAAKYRTMLSADEIAAEYPDMDAEAFTQGMLDGIAMDPFRLARFGGVL